ncbi:SHOCT domain-containing protein [Colwellia echini]|uniref:SHOCT domain-containing protein n=1 Tax=Colwellia echini TaxID=1982103 RepID=A0ABY3N009_9GAMM|nr:SHOCT domain-containing protein [Colwellia echini]TYK66749.1 SHOCT domain-containing protein [Colwellia echini]
MQNLTDIGENLVSGISNRYGVSREAVIHMMVAINNGGGSMAQFSCPELGGSGQWMRGGMTMVGDMFNNGLKTTVDNLCSELANILSNNQIFPVVPAGSPGSNQWWPANLGSPFSSGAQNNIRYAIFPNRLVVELNGQLSIYDTLDHNIGGISQQQGNSSTLNFTSQWGNIDVRNLPLISGPGQSQPEDNIPTSPMNEQAVDNTATPVNQATEASMPPVNSQAVNTQAMNSSSTTYSVTETLEIIDKLAKLRDNGALTDEEYNLKKADLLKRI